MLNQTKYSSPYGTRENTLSKKKKDVAGIKHFESTKHKRHPHSCAIVLNLSLVASFPRYANQVMNAQLEKFQWNHTVGAQETFTSLILKSFQCGLGRILPSSQITQNAINMANRKKQALH